MKITWDKETISKLKTEEIENLRQNAEKRSNAILIDLCNEVLAARKPSRKHKNAKSSSATYVAEFHFVCQGGLGVTRNSDGTIWTGTWVVAREHADLAVRLGSLVALHESKLEKSYIQGIVKDWKLSPREEKYSGEAATQIKEGIDFLIQPTNDSVGWIGDGSGEKGYAWVPFPNRRSARTALRVCSSIYQQSRFDVVLSMYRQLPDQ